ncbi:hypothetical protein C7821_1362 [Streptomyces sp. VMFN-G11Ma]|jgi:fructose transport system substrate-binding protein|nr:hypothetical protein C7821_1362 [Streptomyces sp. VMFN-G11Ma]
MRHLRTCARVPVIAAVGVALLVAGCSSTKSGGSDSGTDSGGKIAIGLVTKTNSNPNHPLLWSRATTA